MGNRPVRILLSQIALDECGAAIRQAFGEQRCELLASESAGAAPDARIAFVTRDVIGKSTRAVVQVATQRFFDQMRDSPHLDWVQLNAAGADRPIYMQLHERGVKVTTASGANAQVVAQTALAAFLSISRCLPAFGEAQKARLWKPLVVTGMPRDLRGQTAVIVGWGPIGRHLAALLKLLGLDVVVARNQSVPAGEGFKTLTFEALHTVLPKTDWIFLACPLTDKTRGLLDQRAFAAMPKGAHVVNVARGEVVVEKDLVEALCSGHLGGAYLDVFEREPLDPASPLWAMPNVIVTAHSAGQSDGVFARVAEIFVDNLALWLEGRPLRNLVT